MAKTNIGKRKESSEEEEMETLFYPLTHMYTNSKSRRKVGPV